MLARWPIVQGSSSYVVLDKHAVARWPLFLGIVVSHCTVQVHAGLVAKVSCDSVAVFVSGGLRLPLGKPSAVWVGGDGQQFIMSCPGRAADQM